MHIPDGILDPKVWASSAVVTVAVLAKSVQYSRSKLQYRAVPVMGVMSAFIFASQMINFPLLGAATSGHLIGGALAALLFGFWPATLIMTTVVAIQAIVFQDGGITALGTNLLNMAILAPGAAALVYRLLRSVSFIPRSVKIFITSWLSVQSVTLVVAVELALSGVVPFGTGVKALLFWHTFIGIGEGIITAIVLPFALRSSFQLRQEESLTQ
ncbi:MULTISPECIES: energy-coupling factor ABC transporter permease [Paenibacillus]|uniref:Energy-coupling factor ABC transporter permease n=1 Tax=Paenibacillus radicis (ex Xue et al. 2023) TaxID=2972489 RepID=A0ABT1Y9C3_9BACL|nr:energy-coupling factor ABC transporter permease [Paenibacillus radicis (ex Xue et al. 2023)]MCR8629786.1 energy-coupling factor ABC transporter permease [Paenibacillus radicis (ex Xue et al. 2023)]